MNRHGALGLFLFLSGAFYISVVSVRDTLGDVPWQYMPQETLAAGVGLYSATFIPVAEGYMAVLDGVGDIQAQAYIDTGRGASVAATALAKTPAVAAVAQWYADSTNRINARLMPQ